MSLRDLMSRQLTYLDEYFLLAIEVVGVTRK